MAFGSGPPLRCREDEPLGRVAKCDGSRREADVAGRWATGGGEVTELLIEAESRLLNGTGEVTDAAEVDERRPARVGRDAKDVEEDMDEKEWS